MKKMFLLTLFLPIYLQQVAYAQKDIKPQFINKDTKKALILPELTTCTQDDPYILQEMLQSGKFSIKDRNNCKGFCSQLNSKSYLNSLNNQINKHFKNIQQTQIAIKKAVELSFLKTTRALVLLNQKLTSKIGTKAYTEITQLNKKYSYQLTENERKQLRIVYTNIIPFIKDRNRDAFVPGNTLEELQSALIKLTAKDGASLRVTQTDLDILNMTYSPIKKQREKSGITKKRFFDSFIQQMRDNYPHRNFLTSDLNTLNYKLSKQSRKNRKKAKQLQHERKQKILELARFIQSIKNSVELCKKLYPSKFQLDFNIQCMGHPIPEVLSSDQKLENFSQLLTNHLENRFNMTPYISASGLEISACFDKKKNKTILKFKKLPDNQEWQVAEPKSSLPPLTNKELKYEVTREFSGYLKNITLTSKHRNRPRKVQVKKSCNKERRRKSKQLELFLDTTSNKQKQITGVIIRVTYKEQDLTKDANVFCRLGKEKMATTMSGEHQFIKISSQAEEQTITCVASKAGFKEAKNSITIPKLEEDIFKLTITSEKVNNTINIKAALQRNSTENATLNCQPIANIYRKPPKKKKAQQVKENVKKPKEQPRSAKKEKEPKQNVKESSNEDFSKPFVKNEVTFSKEMGEIEKVYQCTASDKIHSSTDRFTIPALEQKEIPKTETTVSFELGGDSVPDTNKWQVQVEDVQGAGDNYEIKCTIDGKQPFSLNEKKLSKDIEKIEKEQKIECTLKDVTHTVYTATKEPEEEDSTEPEVTKKKKFKRLKFNPIPPPQIIQIPPRQPFFLPGMP